MKDFSSRVMQMAILFLLVCLGASAQIYSAPVFPPTKWIMVYSNSNDGWNGPVAVAQISEPDGRVITEISLNYKPFNTNAIVFEYVTNNVARFRLTLDDILTNSIVMDTNAINKAVESGTMCAVRGHSWELGCGVVGCLVIHGDEPLRHCVLCKKTERRELGPWK